MSTPLRITEHRVGLGLSRLIRSLAFEHPEAGAAFAQSQGWGTDADHIVEILRAPVGATAAADLAVNPIHIDASARIRRSSAIATVALHVPDAATAFTLARPVAQVVVAGSAIPLQTLVATSPTFAPVQIAGMVAASKEVFRWTVLAEALTNLFADSIGQALDEYAFGILEAGTTLTASAATVAGLDVSLADAISAFADGGGDLSTACWILQAEGAARMGLLRSASGGQGYPGLDVRTGGTLAGVPVLVSRASPSSTSGSQILLVGSNAIIMADAQIEISRSEVAAIEQSSSPTGSAITPTVVQMVSMFQADSIALRGVLVTALASVPSAVVRINGVAF